MRRNLAEIYEKQYPFSTLTVTVGWQEGHRACKYPPTATLEAFLKDLGTWDWDQA